MPDVKGPSCTRALLLPMAAFFTIRPWRGEHISSEREFRAGRRLRVLRLDQESRGRALRAAQATSRRYNLLSNNCEHTVNRAATGRATSPQLQGWIAGAGIAVLAFALIRPPRVGSSRLCLRPRPREAAAEVLRQRLSARTSLKISWFSAGSNAVCVRRNVQRW